MKCDYCKKEALYSFAVVLETETINIFCCDDHFENAEIKQDHIKDEEIFQQRMRMITRKIENFNKFM